MILKMDENHWECKYHEWMKCSNVDKPSEILIKTSNTMKYNEFDIQIIEGPRTDDPII